jgi:hypothetical protein
LKHKAVLENGNGTNSHDKCRVTTKLALSQGYLLGHLLKASQRAWLQTPSPS